MFLYSSLTIKSYSRIPQSCSFDSVLQFSLSKALSVSLLSTKVANQKSRLLIFFYIFLVMFFCLFVCFEM